MYIQHPRTQHGNGSTGMVQRCDCDADMYPGGRARLVRERKRTGRGHSSATQHKYSTEAVKDGPERQREREKDTAVLPDGRDLGGVMVALLRVLDWDTVATDGRKLDEGKVADVDGRQLDKRKLAVLDDGQEESAGRGHVTASKMLVITSFFYGNLWDRKKYNKRLSR